MGGRQASGSAESLRRASARPGHSSPGRSAFAAPHARAHEAWSRTNRDPVHGRCPARRRKNDATLQPDLCDCEWAPHLFPAHSSQGPSNPQSGSEVILWLLVGWTHSLVPYCSWSHQVRLVFGFDFRHTNWASQHWLTCRPPIEDSPVAGLMVTEKGGKNLQKNVDRWSVQKLTVAVVQTGTKKGPNWLGHLHLLFCPEATL